MSEKSLMKLASDLGVSFSAAKILEDHVRAEYDAKLRTADALISAIREDSPLSANVRKAIAEYEGNA